MRKSPTRTDVARLAGVSPAVVSYVVNNGPRPVSDSAREKVNAAIQTLGYRPNQVAKALRANRSLSIGLLLPDALNPFFWELTQRIERECLDRGYMLFIGTTNNNPDRERHYLRAFEDRQVDGMIVISATADWKDAAPTSTPRVLIDRSPEHTESAAAKSDGALGARLAVDHLLMEHHRRNVLLLAGPEQLESTVARAKGALAAIAAQPGARAQLLHSDFGFAAGYDATHAAIVADRGIDSIFAFSDVQAIGAVRACEDLGIAVPADISLVAFDGTELTKYTRPRITSIEQHVSTMAIAAMDRILQLISGEQVEAADPIIAVPQLRVQESCGCEISEKRNTP